MNPGDKVKFTSGAEGEFVRYTAKRAIFKVKGFKNKPDKLIKKKLSQVLFRGNELTPAHLEELASLSAAGPTDYSDEQ